MKRNTLPALALLSALLCLAPACTPKTPSLIPDDASISIGRAPFIQPENTADLLAGYISDTALRVPENVFPQLDNDFADLLAEMTSRGYTGPDTARQCMQKQARAAGAPAFEYWLAVGDCMNVELLIVPQIHAWAERHENDPAAVCTDIFLLDIRSRAILSRARYDEKQRALLDNLFGVGKFIARGGRWADAATLAKEGMFKAIKDFGL